MTVYHFSIELGSEELGRLLETCPHCTTVQQLSRRELRGRAVGVPTNSEALVCPNCGGASRNERRGVRVGSALVLAPFAVLLLVALMTGVYMGVSMVVSGEFSSEFAGMAACLVVIAGYFEYRIVKNLRRLLATRELIPLDRGLLTSM